MISFISTVFNEERNINQFLDSLASQSLVPSEIVIVDGGSTDKTVRLIQEHKLAKKIKIFKKKGNRSVGRNFAIENSRGDIIACSDSGNILDRNWLKNIVLPFKDKQIDVVAGYYKGKPANIFQKCLIPYVLVMKDRVDPKSFLPATRSMAFRKVIWEKVGKFNSNLSHNEDYAFARKLREAGARISFQEKAIAYWVPRNNLVQSFIMFFRFAYGDAQAKIFRPKVALIFVRYILILTLILAWLLSKSNLFIELAVILLVLYVLWAVMKNYKYVNHAQALFWLPVLQFTSDLAVILGTPMALLSKK